MYVHLGVGGGALLPPRAQVRLHWLRGGGGAGRRALAHGRQLSMRHIPSMNTSWRLYLAKNPGTRRPVSVMERVRCGDGSGLRNDRGEGKQRATAAAEAVEVTQTWHGERGGAGESSQPWSHGWCSAPAGRRSVLTSLVDLERRVHARATGVDLAAQRGAQRQLAAGAVVVGHLEQRLVEQRPSGAVHNVALLAQPQPLLVAVGERQALGSAHNVLTTPGGNAH